MLINPYILSDVALLLHCDGTDASTDFPDASDSHHEITVAGNAQVDTAQSKFGGASLLLGGVVTDYIALPPSDTWWQLWRSDTTIDFWINFNALPAASIFRFVRQFVNGGNTWTFQYNSTTGNLELIYIYLTTLQGSFETAWTPSTATWYHLAVERYGDDTNFYVDGTKLTTTVNLAWRPLPVLTTDLDIGTNVDGWIDEFRVSKGIARYEGSNFTPETAEYA